MAATSAFAIASFWFAQDNFTLKFGQTGAPGSAGGVFTSTGNLKDWSVNSNVAWFKLTGSNPVAAQLVGDKYYTDYVSTMTIYAGALGDTTTTLWTGAGGITTIINADGSKFAAPVRPAYETQPVQYQGWGHGDFTATSTSTAFSNALFKIEWLGSYNWGYDNAVGGSYGPNSTYQNGNIQAKATAVPEPFTVVLGILGLSSVAGFRRLRRK